MTPNARSTCRDVVKPPMPSNCVERSSRPPRRAVAEACCTVVVGEGVGGEQVLQLTGHGIDLDPLNQSVDERPAFCLPLLRRCYEVLTHRANVEGKAYR